MIPKYKSSRAELIHPAARQVEVPFNAAPAVHGPALDGLFVGCRLFETAGLGRRRGFCGQEATGQS
jgi:hypothetical protein